MIEANFWLFLWPYSEGQQMNRPSERTVAMKHNLKISVSNEPQTGGVVRCRNVSLREKLLTLLLGSKERMMILIPGNSVAELSIVEMPEGGATNDPN